MSTRINLILGLKQIPFKIIIIETLLIVIGVLTALAVDNWTDDRKRKAKEKTVLERIAIELSNNIQILEARLLVHDSIYSNISNVASTFFELDNYNRPVLSNPNIRPGRKDLGISQMGGLALEPISLNAWQTALSADILTNLDFEILFALSNTYTAMSDLSVFVQKLFSSLSQFEQSWLGEVAPVGAFAEFQKALLDEIIRARTAKNYADESLRILSEIGIKIPKDYKINQ